LHDNSLITITYHHATRSHRVIAQVSNNKSML